MNRICQTVLQSAIRAWVWACINVYQCVCVSVCYWACLFVRTETETARETFSYKENKLTSIELSKGRLTQTEMLERLPRFGLWFIFIYVFHFSSEPNIKPCITINIYYFFQKGLATAAAA